MGGGECLTWLLWWLWKNCLLPFYHLKKNAVVYVVEHKVSVLPPLFEASSFLFAVNPDYQIKH